MSKGAQLNWTDFKAIVVAKNLAMQWTQVKKVYWIVAFDGPYKFECIIRVEDPAQDADQIDFETNFKDVPARAITPVDSDGSSIQRPKTTKTGWHYEPRSLDFYTSKHLSLYNRKHNGNGIGDGTDYGDALLKFYDASGVELTKGAEESDVDFQTRLTSGCVRTHMDWHPQYDMDIIGGILMIKNPPTDPAYLWVIVAPDIPENLGGSVPHVSGGWNLSFLPAHSILQVNGRGVKTVVLDNVYNTNKFRMICKHPVGAQIGIQMVYEHFKG